MWHQHLLPRDGAWWHHQRLKARHSSEIQSGKLLMWIKHTVRWLAGITSHSQNETGVWKYSQLQQALLNTLLCCWAGIPRCSHLQRQGCISMNCKQSCTPQHWLFWLLPAVLSGFSGQDFSCCHYQLGGSCLPMQRGGNSILCQRLYRPIQCPVEVYRSLTTDFTENWRFSLCLRAAQADLWGNAPSSKRGFLQGATQGLGSLWIIKLDQ